MSRLGTCIVTVTSKMEQQLREFWTREKEKIRREAEEEIRRLKQEIESLKKMMQK